MELTPCGHASYDLPDTMRRMRFSVATPVLNGMPFIKRCVGSVRGQTLPSEHIISDGGSTDGTVDWLRTQDGLLWESSPDSGMYDAISKAWQYAAGDVLSWLNSDEQYLPGTFAAVERAFDVYPETEVVFGDMIVVDAEGSPISARREISLRPRYVTNGVLYSHSCATFFRRQLWDRGWMAIDSDLQDAGDMKLILDLLVRRVIFKHVPIYLGLFTWHEDNRSRRQRAHEEVEFVRMQTGASKWKLFRSAIRLARRAEKLIAGKYLPSRLSYRYAVDEFPNYRLIGPTWVGTGFPR